MNATVRPRRVLVVDDNQTIHRDFAKILAPQADATNELASASAALFGTPVPVDGAAAPAFQVDFATQGEQALQMVQQAMSEGAPYSLAFVDMRMPPGWDGLETIERMWRAATDLQVVICTAYSDHSMAKISGRLGHPDRLLVLKKPFDAVEVEQLATSLTEKWRLTRDERAHMQELREALARAEVAARTKSQFLANMSHEIRTPMTGILGAAEVLVDEELPRSEQLKYLRTIQDSGSHMLRILGDILDFSKVEAGQMLIEIDTFSIASLLRASVAMLQPAATKKGLTLRTQYRGNFPDVVRGDPTRIRQILFNLVGNALKFTERGHVELRARVDRAGTDVAMLVLEIEDTGVGILPEHMLNLFAPFAQGDASTSRKFGGTGLGLAISRRIARAMGGDIDVVSWPERGSCFTVTLQLALPPTCAWGKVGARSGDEGGGEVDATPHQKLTGRILLVDDEPNNQMLFARVLQKAGADVEVCSDARSALTRWEEVARTARPFDLVISDLHMPEVDGYEMAKRLLAAGCRTPLIALTASAATEDRERCLRSGWADYLSKPIGRKDLVQACARALAAPRPNAPR